MVVILLLLVEQSVTVPPILAREEKLTAVRAGEAPESGAKLPSVETKAGKLMVVTELAEPCVTRKFPPIEARTGN
jgi:hypothetical protein